MPETLFFWQVKQTLISEYRGHYIIAFGDTQGNVVLLRVERYTPLSIPGTASDPLVAGVAGTRSPAKN